MKICPRTFFKKKDNEFRAITTWENQLMFVKINDLIQWVIGSVQVGQDLSQREKRKKEEEEKTGQERRENDKRGGQPLKLLSLKKGPGEEEVFLIQSKKNYIH